MIQFDTLVEQANIVADTLNAIKQMAKRYSQSVVEINLYTAAAYMVQIACNHMGLNINKYPAPIYGLKIVAEQLEVELEAKYAA